VSEKARGVGERARRLARRVRAHLPASGRHLEGARRDTEVQLETLAASVGHLDARLTDIERRLVQVQGLSARVYEAQLDWRERLEEIRAEPGYEEPFSGDPLVSVRIATFNNAKQLCERCLASVRRQTYENWEALVVGDATEDDTAERLEAIGDPRIRFWNLPFRGPYPENPKSRWQVAGTPPMNAAVAEARGGWIAPLDDDDEFDDDHIEVLLRAAQSEHAELAYGRMRVVIEGADERTEFGAWPPRFTDFGFQSALYHAALKEFGYDMNAWLADEVGDWNLARRMWEAGVSFTFVNRIVGTYHVAEGTSGKEAWGRRTVTRPLREH
jgi:Glycosyl transferase family 2